MLWVFRQNPLFWWQDWQDWQLQFSSLTILPSLTQPDWYWQGWTESDLHHQDIVTSLWPPNFTNKTIETSILLGGKARDPGIFYRLVFGSIKCFQQCFLLNFFKTGKNVDKCLSLHFLVYNLVHLLSPHEYFTPYKSSSYTPPFFPAMRCWLLWLWLVRPSHVRRVGSCDWLVVGDTEMNCASPGIKLLR